ncbi:MAG: hypothetical protein R2832_09050 [Rhodothermales bacterium]
MRAFLPLFFLFLSAASQSNTTTAQPAHSGNLIESGRTWQAGTTLRSEFAGITFRIPEGFVAQYDPESSGVLMQRATDGVIVGVWGFSEASVDELGAAVVELIAKQDVSLYPEKQERIDERSLDATFRAVTPQGIGRLVGSVRQAETGNAIAVVALGSEQSGDLPDVVDVVTASVAWKQPSALEWKELLAGRAFTGSKNDSDYSSGGAGGYGSYASTDKSLLAFCDAETYAFSSESESYFSIDGASSSSVSSDAHRGRWWLVADLAGQAFLILESTEGEGYRWPVSEGETGLIVNGRTYQPTNEHGC